jgi:hypothetical protein
MSEILITIDPAILKELHAEIAAEELERQEKAKNGVLVHVQAATDELPAKVAAFWNAPEPWIPPWRLESAAEREHRPFSRIGVTWRD